MKGHPRVSFRRKMTFKRVYAAPVALCLCWCKFSNIDKPRTGATLCADWHTQIEGARKTWCLPNQYKKGEKPKRKWLHSTMLTYQLRTPHVSLLSPASSSLRQVCPHVYLLLNRSWLLASKTMEWISSSHLSRQASDILLPLKLTKVTSPLLMTLPSI